MFRNPTYIAWIALLAAIVAWAGVGLFASTILSEQADRVTHAAQSQDTSSQASQALELHALVANTASIRTELDTLVTVDPATLAGAIDTAGKSAGVSIEISNASTVSAPAQGGGVSTQVFAFTAAAHGSFAAAMRAAELLETLPVPSSIQEIQFIESPTTPGATSGAGSWQMNAQVRVLTASTVSS